MIFCCVCCVLSGRGLCDELITRPEVVLPILARRCELSNNLVKRGDHGARENNNNNNILITIILLILRVQLMEICCRGVRKWKKDGNHCSRQLRISYLTLIFTKTNLLIFLGAKLWRLWELYRKQRLWEKCRYADNSVWRHVFPVLNNGL
jgi:hypothetical protein